MIFLIRKITAELKTSKMERKIPGLSSAMKTSTVELDMDYFLFYTKSRAVIFVGNLVKPLVSNGEIIVDDDEKCKIKINSDHIDFAKMKNINHLEFIIKNNYEERTLNGKLVKQFTAVIVSDYIYEGSDSLSHSF